MRVLAFDYGTKRIGIAVTDPLQIIATGLDTIHPKDIIAYLKKYLSTEQVELFVVGEPKQMNGSPSQSAPQIKGFITTLNKNFPDIPVEQIDERFTSKMAFQTMIDSGLNKHQRKNKALLDEISATIMLQDYLR